jgi:prepilin-type N-terminal cleavage/methylation domain-containing protein
MNKGFTLIELVVVIAITTILAGIILFTVQQYLSAGKDANVSANLSVLIPAGEAWYNGNGNSYANFCNPNQVGPNPGNSAVKNAISQMPYNLGAPCFQDLAESSWTSTANPRGFCCYVNGIGDEWAACIRKFSDITKAFCVDSRGIQKEITKDQCAGLASENPLQCPDLAP